MSDAAALSQGGVIGRFAPSPSGPLHFGSLCTAVASYLQARSQHGRWLVRIDDLDPPREQAGAADTILRTLEAAGLTWDGEVVYQSARRDAYGAAIEKLSGAGATFVCTCSRRDVGAGPYAGTCRDGPGKQHGAQTLRLRVNPTPVVVPDRIQGDYAQNLFSECGDFVIRRADGCYSYHLAVVVDDAAAGVTEVIRGSDLMSSTPRQWFLQQCLSLPHPLYAHLPVVLDRAGVKLSKQTGAQPVVCKGIRETLWHALNFLGLAPPQSLFGAAAEALLSWGLAHWRIEAVGASDRHYAALAAANIAFNSA